MVVALIKTMKSSQQGGGGGGGRFWLNFISEDEVWRQEECIYEYKHDHEM